ncbi:MAG: hypothetical protein AAGF12_14750 [Myxococcota bacterium]
MCRIVLGAACLIVWSCGGEVTSTQIVVVLDATGEALRQTDAIVVRVSDQEGSLRFERTVELGPNANFPFTIPIVPTDGDANRRVRFEATARDGFTDVDRIDEELGFVADTVQRVRFVFGGAVSADAGMDATVDIDSAVNSDADAGSDAAVVQPPPQLFTAPDFRGAPAVYTPVLSETVVPGSPEEGWVFLVSGRITGPVGFSEPLICDAALRIDGEIRSLVGAVGGGSNSLFSPWLAFDFRTGSTDPIQIEVVARCISQMSLRDLRVVAFPLPPGSAPLIADSAIVQHRVGTSFEVLASLDFAGASAGEYLVFAGVTGSEEDVEDGPPYNGGVGINVQIRNGLLSTFPSDPSTFRHGRLPFRSFTIALPLNIVPSQVVSLEVASAGGLATARHARLLAFRTDAFHSFESALAIATVQGTPEDQEVPGALTTSPPTGGTHYLTWQAGVTNLPQADGSAASLSFIDASGQRVDARTLHIRGGDVFSAGLVGVEESAAPITLRNVLGAGSPSTNVSYSVIYALRL